jgi:hypothetical protein
LYWGLHWGQAPAASQTLDKVESGKRASLLHGCKKVLSSRSLLFSFLDCPLNINEVWQTIKILAAK